MSAGPMSQVRCAVRFPVRALVRFPVRASSALGLCALVSACAVSGGYHPAPAVPEATRVGDGAHAGARADSTRAFFDSLSVARAADTAAALPARPAPQPPRALAAEALADLSWLDILRDSALTRLVAQALRQNRDVAFAQARIDEYRALAGAARSPLLPSVTVNGSASKNQIVFGGSPPVAYTAYRLTGDVAWELDFWGKNRRGLQAADLDEAAQAAAARGAVLSLVSDVAGGYLQLLELDQEHAVAEQTLASRRATLALARERFARGVISELDVRQFEAQVAVPAARLAQVEQFRSQQEHALNVLLGEGPAAIPRGTSLAAAARGVTVPDSIPASLLARRPDVEQAERAYAAATARIGVADAARLPIIAITGSYGSQTATPGALFGSGGRSTRRWSACPSRSSREAGSRTRRGRRARAPTKRGPSTSGPSSRRWGRRATRSRACVPRATWRPPRRRRRSRSAARWSWRSSATGAACRATWRSSTRSAASSRQSWRRARPSSSSSPPRCGSTKRWAGAGRRGTSLGAERAPPCATSSDPAVCAGSELAVSDG